MRTNVDVVHGYLPCFCDMTIRDRMHNCEMRGANMARIVRRVYWANPAGILQCCLCRTEKTRGISNRRWATSGWLRFQLVTSSDCLSRRLLQSCCSKVHMYIINTSPVPLDKTVPHTYTGASRHVLSKSVPESPWALRNCLALQDCLFRRHSSRRPPLLNLFICAYICLYGSVLVAIRSRWNHSRSRKRFVAIREQFAMLSRPRTFAACIVCTLIFFPASNLGRYPVMTAVWTG